MFMHGRHQAALGEDMTWTVLLPMLMLCGHGGPLVILSMQLDPKSLHVIGPVVLVELLSEVKTDELLTDLGV